MLLDKEHNITKIYDILYQLGLSANYASFFYTAYAVLLAIENTYRLQCITLMIYPSVAAHYHTTWLAVSRGIQAVISVVWRLNPKLLKELAGADIEEKPSPTQFIAILATYYSDKWVA